MIDTYSFGRMIIDGRKYTKDLWILPNGEIVCPWWRITGHELVLADIEELMAARPDLLIIGTGANGVMRLAPGLESVLRARGIRTVVLPTAEAVERYNSLRGEDSGIAACFHLTC